MKSIAQPIVLPEIIAQAIAEKPELAAAFWARASEQHYAAVVEQNRDHLLIFVKEQVDFRAVVEACRGYQDFLRRWPAFDPIFSSRPSTFTPTTQKNDRQLASPKHDPFLKHSPTGVIVALLSRCGRPDRIGS